MGACSPLQRRHGVAEQHERVHSLERILPIRRRKCGLEAFRRFHVITEAPVGAAHRAVTRALDCGWKGLGAAVEHVSQAFGNVLGALGVGGGKRTHNACSTGEYCVQLNTQVTLVMHNSMLRGKREWFVTFNARQRHILQ